MASSDFWDETGISLLEQLMLQAMWLKHDVASEVDVDVWMFWTYNAPGSRRYEPSWDSTTGRRGVKLASQARAKVAMQDLYRVLPV